MIKQEKVYAYLKKASVKGSILGLSRIEELLEKTGNPQNNLKIVHLSGTNGKGSFCAMMSAVMSRAGYKIGSFSSPYLINESDSFKINGHNISEEIFINIMYEVIEAAETMNDGPTEFELLTAAAFLMFYKEKCDFCIIECGLGGDGDSTNVISKPLLSVITNVQKDHCHILGNSISEIAEHKAGIIKKNCPVLYCGENSVAIDVIRKKAAISESELYLCDKSSLKIKKSDINGTVFDFEDFKNIRLSLAGLYQTVNAANVITALGVMKKLGVSISDNAIYKGLENCIWRGRFEVVSREPVVIFDGSHNPDGMGYTVQSIKEYFSVKPIMIMGVMADKEYSLYGDMLKNIAEIIYTVTPDNKRALDSKILAESFKHNGISAIACDSMSEAVKKAFEYAREKKLPIVALGSLYMYKDFMEKTEAYLH